MSLYFYLGTHMAHWLGTVKVPLFVQHGRLVDRKTLPKAAAPWALDSGGFSEIKEHGQYRTTPEAYVQAVRWYDNEIDELTWAAPQDWMCEPATLARTGLTVGEHQDRTVANFVQLQDLWDDNTTSPFMPVLQGWAPTDYVRCMDKYEAAGVDFMLFPLVGVGSVCQREATAEIGEVIHAIIDRDPEIPLHGFGVKTRGLERYGHRLTSADSLAWSDRARWAGKPLPGCEGHKTCSNCVRYALHWRDRALEAFERGADKAWAQPGLFDPPQWPAN